MVSRTASIICAG